MTFSISGLFLSLEKKWNERAGKAGWADTISPRQLWVLCEGNKFQNSFHIRQKKNNRAMETFTNFERDIWLSELSIAELFLRSEEFSLHVFTPAAKAILKR